MGCLLPVIYLMRKSAAHRWRLNAIFGEKGIYLISVDPKDLRPRSFGSLLVLLESSVNCGMDITNCGMAITQLFLLARTVRRVTAITDGIFRSQLR
jgi:hypothetical protein